MSKLGSVFHDMLVWLFFEKLDGRVFFNGSIFDHITGLTAFDKTPHVKTAFVSESEQFVITEHQWRFCDSYGILWEKKAGADFYKRVKWGNVERLKALIKQTEQLDAVTK